MPCVSRFVERLGDPCQAEVAHHARPEPRIQQVQDRVLDAADVLVDRHPVVRALIDHGAVVARAGVAEEVPRRIDERVHRVRLATRGLAALRARAVEELRVLGERIAAAVRHEVFGQHDRQLVVRHGLHAARRRNGSAGSGNPSSAGARCPSRAGGSSRGACPCPAPRTVSRTRRTLRRNRGRRTDRN